MKSACTCPSAMGSVTRLLPLLAFFVLVSFAAATGCPEEAPVVGTSCAPRAAACSYGFCCTHEFMCEAGKWADKGGGCPG